MTPQLKPHERRNWHDTLNLENVDFFVARLRELLGDQYFTFITSNYGLQIRTNQILRGRSTKPGGWQTFPDGSPENLGRTVDTDPKWCHVLACDSYGVWSVSEGAYFSFEDEFRSEPKRVTITFKAGAGHEIIWMMYPTGPYSAELERIRQLQD